MRQTPVLFFIIILCFTSCKLVDVAKNEGKVSNPNLVLGSIGELENNIISNKFSEAGVPILEGKIKLTVEYKLFNKRKLRRINSEITKEDEKLKIVDSINLHLGYFKLTLSDKIGYIKALNHIQNKEVKSFLEDTEKNQVVSGIEIFFPEEITEKLKAAKEVYLIDNGKSSYALELLQNNGTRSIINFNQGKLIGFEFSSFCWKTNYKNKAEVAALRNVNSSCPGSTIKNPGKLDSKDIFEKMN